MYQSKLEVEERKMLKPNLVFLINTDYTLRGGYTHEHTYTDTHTTVHTQRQTTALPPVTRTGLHKCTLTAFLYGRHGHLIKDQTDNRA